MWILRPLFLCEIENTMDYEELLKDNDFHKWHKYEPLDTQYIRFARCVPSVIAAGHKICDVYYAFANAKQSFRSANYKNFGDLADDNGPSKLYTKSHFLLSAISEYALCLDLSWQVVWAYIQPSSFEYLMAMNYKKMEKECDRDNLFEQIDCAIAQHSIKATKLKNILKEFDNDSDVKRLRILNNSIKHHGTIHFDGLGANFSSMMLVVNGETVSTLSRTSYKIEEIENLLFAYHSKFQKYFNSIIDEVIPDDYLESDVSFKAYVNTLIEMKNVQTTDN